MQGLLSWLTDSRTDNGTAAGTRSCDECVPWLARQYSTASVVEERTACACAAGSITDKGNDTGATTCMACAAGQYSTASARAGYIKCMVHPLRCG
jgi:hypothetical protein